MVGVVMIVLGVVRGFGLLKIRIFGYCSIWISYLYYGDLCFSVW